MAQKRTRSRHRRLFPTWHPDEQPRSRHWQFGTRIIKDRSVALAFEREIVRQERLARADGRVIDPPAILNSLPWDSVPWYVRVPRQETN